MDITVYFFDKISNLIMNFLNSITRKELIFTYYNMLLEDFLNGKNVINIAIIHLLTIVDKLVHNHQQTC